MGDGKPAAHNAPQVAETAPEAIAEDKDSINGVQQLALEATAINQNFSQQVLLQGGRRLVYDEPNPFAVEGSSEELAAVAYRCAVADHMPAVVSTRLLRRPHACCGVHTPAAPTTCLLCWPLCSSCLPLPQPAFRAATLS
jgi:hypothetical protein